MYILSYRILADILRYEVQMFFINITTHFSSQNVISDNSLEDLLTIIRGLSTTLILG